MYALIGIYNDIAQEKVGGPFLDNRTEEIVALFTTEKKAKTYMKKCTLEKPIFDTFIGYRPYHKSSLLNCCESAKIEKFVKPKYIIDPEI